MLCEIEEFNSILTHNLILPFFGKRIPEDLSRVVEVVVWPIGRKENAFRTSDELDQLNIVGCFLRLLYRLCTVAVFPNIVTGTVLQKWYFPPPLQKFLVKSHHDPRYPGDSSFSKYDFEFGKSHRNAGRNHVDQICDHPEWV